MANQNSLWPGQRPKYETGSAPSTTSSSPSRDSGEERKEQVPKIPKVPHRYETAGTAAAGRVRNLPAIGTGWLEMFFRRGAKGRISPLTRIRLAVGGLVLTAWSGYLTYIFMQHAFPNLNNLVVEVAPALLLGLVETFLFVRGKSLLSMGVILAFEACDIYMNGVGFMRLLEVNQFRAVSDQGILIAVVALGSAILPEMLIAAAAE